MSDRLAYSNSSTLGEFTSHLKDFKKLYGIVIDVILDDTHERVTDELDFSENEKKNTGIIGNAIIRVLDDSVGSTETLRPYPPANMDEGLPIIGEAVELLDIGGRLHFKRVYSPNISKGNSVFDKEKNTYPTKRGEVANSSTYNEVALTSIPIPEGGLTESSTFGKYFTEQQIHPLKLYEGDKLIQSRFGQSIRFSGYNNQDNSFAPTIIIRNRQNSEIEKEPKFKLTSEDVNKDGSIILMTSGDFQIDLKAGTIDDGGSQQIETKPNKFEEYPSELKGNDQILINSERIILSSKSKEMIFFSKGNYGFISDGKFSIDNGKAGAELDFNGEFRMTMNDNPTYLLGQGTSGKIFLNIESEAEPLVRGETLKKLLTQLIDELLKIVFATPAGPTSPGPLPPHVQKLNQIKKDLQTMLSTTNFTE